MYPNCWLAVDLLRSRRGLDLVAWPSWCFLPLTGAFEILSTVCSPSVLELADFSSFTALATWRVTQGIYRFEPEIYEAVCNTRPTIEIPFNILYKMPEWCVYIQTQRMESHGVHLYGAFAHLEWNARTARTHLILVFDTNEGLLPSRIEIGQWNLAEAIDRLNSELQVAAAFLWMPLATPEEQAIFRNIILTFSGPVVSLLLYLCSQAAEIGDGTHAPRNPQPKTVRGLARQFPADKPTTWEVGVRLGAALRQARRSEEAENAEKGSSSAGPRPHIRRAHWHGFWTGSREGDHRSGKEKRRFDLRWLPPIAVKVTDASVLPAVVRPVT